MYSYIFTQIVLLIYFIFSLCDLTFLSMSAFPCSACNAFLIPNATLHKIACNKDKFSTKHLVKSQEGLMQMVEGRRGSQKICGEGHSFHGGHMRGRVKNFWGGHTKNFFTSLHYLLVNDRFQVLLFVASVTFYLLFEVIYLRSHMDNEKEIRRVGQICFFFDDHSHCTYLLSYRVW